MKKWIILSLCLVILIGLASVIIIISENDINYSIKLTSDYIPEGFNITVLYKINNGRISGIKKNVTFFCWIENQSRERLGYIYRMYLGDLNSGDELHKQLMVPVNFLEKDDYFICTKLSYENNYKEVKFKYKLSKFYVY